MIQRRWLPNLAPWLTVSRRPGRLLSWSVPAFDGFRVDVLIDQGQQPATT